MNHFQIKKLSLCGLLCALGVLGGTFSIPVLASRCCPMQSILNILAAVLLGPWYAAGVGFTIALLRNLLGLGTLFAFPGSVFGALLAGLLYVRLQKLWAACLGECIGTGLLASLSAYPIATLLMGKKAALFTYFIPFTTTAVCGAALGALLVYALQRTGALQVLRTLCDQ